MTVEVKICIDLEDTKAEKGDPRCKHCQETLGMCEFSECFDWFKVGGYVLCVRERLNNNHVHLCKKHNYKEIKDWFKKVTLMGRRLLL